MLFVESVNLLKQLISIPSPSGEEKRTADLIQNYLNSKGILSKRKFNNIWSMNRDFNPERRTVLLNSHLDTVKPGSDWILSPFSPDVKNGKLYGLGSNDAGASLVSLLMTFLFFYDHSSLDYNLIFSATAEEENSGPSGITAILSELGNVDLAIIGEPTSNELAIAEKGLVVLECCAHGASGHAARDIGENAILKAMDDIRWFSSYQFPQISSTLGKVKMTVTMIQAGLQHNVIPDHCQFTVDVRTTDAYSHDEIIQTIKTHIQSEISRCSLRLKASAIDPNHRLIQIAQDLGIPTFASPTLSDQALLNVSSVKIGPGDSNRSHTADEFVYLSEIKYGIQIYIELLSHYLKDNKK